ncbi:hypothetical protein BDV26DRAFT_280645 [Aspergillus bertholletiae]|uniref:Zn(2)-C6 fungal-type domain-containing protein n=1 Tax=Aspergillus bertholletiae TaxID=1226010 RepID=A0A5N7BB58_9EURO|nr:hypothetical protein BDV26DRAFT_280645 [Aspergillus bertholletiae]
MSTNSYANRVCLRCRMQKRKCDKLLPVCSLCKRVNRVCSYMEPNGITGPGDSPEAVFSISLPVPDLAQLTSANVSHTIRTQVLTIIGDERRIQAVAVVYFRTIHPWFPILAEGPFYERLSHIFTHAIPDFSLLPLCMILLGASPVNDELPLRMRSLYILVKGFIASLEATETNSLELLQCRVLLSIFEVGHGMYPAAYISMGANVRAAVALGANAVSKAQLEETFGSPGRADEARCTWRGIVIADRALMTILEFGCSFNIGRSDICATGSYGFIQDAVEELVNASETFAAQITPADLEALPVFTVHPIYKAARILLGVLKNSPRFDSRRAIGALERVLQCMGTRWMAGRRYLDDLNRQMISS